MFEIMKDVYYVGVNDHEIDLFEGQYKVPQGMAYNSYVVLDKEITVFDSVDRRFGDEWLGNIENVLDGKAPNYLVVQHMEPDHSANVLSFMKKYPKATIVGNAKTFAMLNQFYQIAFSEKQLVIKDGDTLCTGNHNFSFVFAPMVHWPEVFMTYDSATKILFSADAFGKFGASDADEPWDDEARRYYIGIVGKYGMQVQTVLKKAASLNIQMVCPLHGPVLTENIGYYINLYDIWSSYRSETDGILIAYTSVYGNTKHAVELCRKKLCEKGCKNVKVTDLARCDMSFAVADAFRFGKIILATTTYNADIFPFMKEFVNHLTERNFQNRRVGIIENGSWAPTAAKTIKSMLEKSKGIEFCDTQVTIKSALDCDSTDALDKLVNEILK